MKYYIRNHKNTAVGILSLGFVVYQFIQYTKGVITFEAFGASVALSGGIAGSIVGIIAPDGKSSFDRKNDEKSSDAACADSTGK